MDEKKSNLLAKFDSILALIKKPISFMTSLHEPSIATTSGGEFEYPNLEKARGVEALMNAQCERAVSLDLSIEVNEKLKELKGFFCGFDSLSLKEKKSRIGLAKNILDFFEALSLEDSKPPRNLKIQKTNKNIKEILENLERLQTPLQFVKGIGPKLGEKFQKKGLDTALDFLYFLPLRYEDRSKVKMIKELEDGERAMVVGEVIVSGVVQYGRRRVFEVSITDGKSLMKLKWFNFRMQYMGRYKPGARVLCFGLLKSFGGSKEIIHPDVEFLADDEEATDNAYPSGIVPVYSQVSNLHQKTIRKLATRILFEFAPFIVGALPREVRWRLGLLEFSEAFKEVHAPSFFIDPATSEASPSMTLARKTLIIDELFTLEVGLLLKRLGLKKESGFEINPKGLLEERLRSKLPFKLTASQERVLVEIKKDMTAPCPMNRLIQGDVGSGKTVVSLIAILNAVEAGFQAAMMAPTEILAEQHYLLMNKFAVELGFKCVLLKSAQTAKEKNKNLALIASGEADLVVGTHALIQKGVEYENLALTIIDEQHRFGVSERAELKRKAKGLTPDILVMTATPIPRTLSMTLFGDLDVSIIDELPSGRKPIKTKLLRDTKSEDAYAQVVKEVSSGAQAYIVYPLVEESEELDLRDATRMKEKLEATVFSDFSVGLIHGRLKSEEKESVMADFKAKKIDILFSTTIIEVGVDVPNATVMVIEHAERFGLAQLHQLRGRVGRGEKKSHCIMIAPYVRKEDTWRRLKIFESTTDGFKIAEEDLKIRGAGDFIGTRQSGLPSFRMSDALGDLRLLKTARTEAEFFLKKDPNLVTEDGQIIKALIKARWCGRLELAEIL
ncbi:MAG: ATP-dependent DNA helicase RecG [Deltaproteobacteria bacterium]|nr:ATP-dependent DNA helicase RecG [Deltaproteobacteria bacterium]